VAKMWLVVQAAPPAFPPLSRLPLMCGVGVALPTDGTRTEPGCYGRPRPSRHRGAVVWWSQSGVGTGCHGGASRS